MKTSLYPYKFCIFSLPYPFVLIVLVFISLPIQKRRELEKMCIYLKIYEIMCVSLSVLLLELCDVCHVQYGFL